MSWVMYRNNQTGDRRPYRTERIAQAARKRMKDGEAWVPVKSCAKVGKVRKGGQR